MVLPITAYHHAYVMKPAGWREIITGPSWHSNMPAWIERHSSDLWYLAGPELYWLSPELYTLWLLKFR